MFSYHLLFIYRYFQFEMYKLSIIVGQIIAPSTICMCYRQDFSYKYTAEPSIVSLWCSSKSFPSFSSWFHLIPRVIKAVLPKNMSAELLKHNAYTSSPFNFFKRRFYFKAPAAATTTAKRGGTIVKRRKTTTKRLINSSYN